MRVLAKLFKTFSVISSVSIILIIGFLIFYPFFKSFGIINMDFILDSPSGAVLGEEGGVFPAIIGSLWFSGLALILAIIPAMGSAIFNSFYSENGKINHFIHSIFENAAAVPSIVYGLFAYAVFVYKLDFGRCIFSASIALALMIFPYLERKIEKAFSEVDYALIESAKNLGTGKFYIIRKIVLPCSMNEILSASILSFCFAMSATAPIIFTGGVAFAPVPKSIFRPAMSLPLHLYLMIAQGETQVPRAYATAFVSFVLILILHFIANILANRNHYRKLKND